MPPLRLAAMHLLGQASRASATFEFAVAAKDPRAAQEDLLLSLLRQNKDTELGRTYDYAYLGTVRDFTERLPLLTPAELGPLVERLMNGDRNILSAEAPIYYVRTTGSTGAAKHVPITPRYRTEFQKTVKVALWNLFLRFPEAFRGTA